MLCGHQSPTFMVITEFMLHDIVMQPLAHHLVLQQNPKILIE